MHLSGATTAGALLAALSPESSGGEPVSAPSFALPASTQHRGPRGATSRVPRSSTSGTIAAASSTRAPGAADGAARSIGVTSYEVGGL
jgi:hypothetical protein